MSMTWKKATTLHTLIVGVIVRVHLCAAAHPDGEREGGGHQLVDHEDHLGWGEGMMMMMKMITMKAWDDYDDQEG